MTPVCQFFSSDGWDDCILTNLIDLFGDLGYVCFRDDVIHPDISLLVIVRGTHLPDADLPPHIPIVVCNYVGKLFAPVPPPFSTRPNPLILFGPDAALFPAELHDRPNTTLVADIPPVSVRRWIARPAPRRWGVIHIGNRKRSDGADQDPLQNTLNQRLTELPAHIWGNGWHNDGLGDRWHGRLPLFAVPAVYARATACLGIMYPFQRVNGIVSGRHWQAPLNGCTVHGEPFDNRLGMPGIVCDPAFALAPPAWSPDELRRAAVVFWMDHYQRILARLRTALPTPIPAPAHLVARLRLRGNLLAKHLLALRSRPWR